MKKHRPLWEGSWHQVNILETGQLSQSVLAFKYKTGLTIKFISYVWRIWFYFHWTNYFIHSVGHACLHDIFLVIYVLHYINNASCEAKTKENKHIWCNYLRNIQTITILDSSYIRNKEIQHHHKISLEYICVIKF